MDLVSTLRSEIFRPAVTIIIPGATAALPYFFILAHYFQSLHNFAQHHQAIALFLAFIVAVAFGLIIEDFGSLFEVQVLDRRLKKKDNRYMEDWYRYLRLAFQEEPIGHRYLRSLTLRLKFELNFGASLIVFWLGVMWLENVKSFLSARAFWWTTVSIALAVAYLLWESYNSSTNLGKVRREILKGVSSAGTRRARKR